MKKWFLFLALSLQSLSFAFPIQDHTIDPDALSKLASALEIPKDADLIVETQNRWLRKAGKERWDLNEISPEQKHFLIGWAQEQGLFAPWKPASETYDKALILGATTPCMQKRLNYLKELWTQGIRFHEIVWLTGERPLVKYADDLIDRCQNESEAAHILWNEADLPQEMRNLPLLFVSVPIKKEGSSIKRPNTEDTIVAWLEKTPKPCKALFVSDQPFCGYQFAVIKTCLPETFEFDLVGEGVDPTSHPAAAAITLDTIARWIYQENIYQSLHR